MTGSLRQWWSMRVITAAVAFALCYGSFAQTLAVTLQHSASARATQAAPWLAEARATAAFVQMQSDLGKPALARSRLWAVTALRREPENVTALHTLGLIASVQGRGAEAEKYFTLVEQVTRRDFTTQLWWIEAEVARGSVSGALRYFDEALRTSSTASSVLMPILVNAVVEQPVAVGLRPFLARRPTYFRAFFIQAADSAPRFITVAALARLLLIPSSADDRDLINRALQRLARDGEFDRALALYRWADARPWSSGVVDGDFDHRGNFSLFSWTISDGDAVTAQVGARGDGSALYLIARQARGQAAKQLLHLSPGHYALSALVGDVSDAALDRPQVSLSCADIGGSSILGTVGFPSTDLSSRVRLRFSVPSGCRFQWLAFNASAVTEDEVRTWVDDVTIRVTR